MLAGSARALLQKHSYALHDTSERVIIRFSLHLLHRMEDLLVNVLQLCPQAFTISSLVALSSCTKSLHGLAGTELQYNETVARSWLLDAVSLWGISPPPRSEDDWEPIGLDIFAEEDPEVAMAKAIAKDDRVRAVQMTPVLWLLSNAAKTWGITQLAARLDLQGALITAAGDSEHAAKLLIAAGARVTEQLVRSAALTAVQGIDTWLHTCGSQGLEVDLPPHLVSIFHGYPLELEELEQFTPQECYTAVAVALSQGPYRIKTSPQELLLQPTLPGTHWTQVELLQLLRVAVQSATAKSNANVWDPRWTYTAAVKALLTPTLVRASTTLTSAQIAELLDLAEDGTPLYDELIQQLRRKPLRSPRAVFHLCRSALHHWDTTSGPVEAWLHTPAAHQLTGADIAVLLKLTFGWVFLEWDCSCWVVVRALLALPSAAALPAAAVAGVLEQVWHWGRGYEEGTVGLVRELLGRCSAAVREEVFRAVNKTSWAMFSWLLLLVQEGAPEKG